MRLTQQMTLPSGMVQSASGLIAQKAPRREGHPLPACLVQQDTCLPPLDWDSQHQLPCSHTFGLRPNYTRALLGLQRANHGTSQSP